MAIKGTLFRTSTARSRSTSICSTDTPDVGA
jgi:hypothetical protein